MFANDNFFVPRRTDVGAILEEARRRADLRRRHLMQVAGAGPLLVLMETSRGSKNFSVPYADLDDCDLHMLRDWPSLIDGE